MYVYGAPKAFSQYGHGRQGVCIDGQCEIIDSRARYSEAISDDQPVLLWHAVNLTDTHEHLLEVWLLDNDRNNINATAFNFEYFEYTGALPPAER